jgi:hypothetical protein
MPRQPLARLVVVGLVLVGIALLAGPRGRASKRPPIHLNPGMDDQLRAEPQATSDFFYDGAAMRPPVAGTVARGELRDSGPYWTGLDASGDFVATIPLDETGQDDAFLERGRRRLGIYCAPCHGRNGDGKGILSERAKIATPSFHQDRLRQAPDGYLFGIITSGFGLMPAYAYPIPVADRWAIIAALRELQARGTARGGAQPVPPTAGTP